MIFIYGTLQANEPNHPLLLKPENGTAVLKGYAQTADKFPLVVGTVYNIPFLLDTNECGENVVGEVYQVDDKMLAACDELEAHPDLYRRRKIDVKYLKEKATPNSFTGEEIECWCYLLPSFTDELLECKPYLVHYKQDVLRTVGKGYVESEEIETAAQLKEVLGK